MTAHSGRGQGDPPLYEGVVLPANGDPWTPEQQRQVDRLHSQPSAGQPWGEPWGPESQAAVAQEEPAGPSLPPPPQSPPPPPPAQPPYIPQQQPSPANEEAGPVAGGRHAGGVEQPAPGFPSAGLPPAQEPPVQAAGPAGADLPPVQPPQTPQGPQAQQGPQAPQAPPAQHLPEPHNGQAFGGNAQLPPQQQPQQPHQPQQPSAGQPQQPSAGQPQPPSAGQQFAQGPGPAQTFPAQQGLQQGVPPAMPAQAPPATPQAPESEATQFIPPVTGAAPQPGQYQAAQAPPAMDTDATQMLPPQTGHASVRDPEATAQLRTPLPPEAPAGQGGGRQQPPAGFESLFRSEPGPDSGGQGDSGGPGATQSLPLFDQAVARQRNGGVGGLGNPGGPAGQGVPGGPGAPGGTYGHGQAAGAGQQAGQWEPQGRAARRNAERSALSRISPGILIGVGVAVVAGVGMLAGAALSSGDEKSKADDKSAAASTGEKKSAGPDPVEAQAKELDKLLADSNNSRATVIRSVENIKSCKNLGRSADDLRAAADQRNSLVTRLGKLETDKIPANAELKSALTRAWKASAAADNHYAAWADQTAGKKGCRKGKARVTKHTGLGARSSGEATAAKKKAAGLWNPTAKKYGLKERQVVQL